VDETITACRVCQNCSKLFPSQNLLVLRPQILVNPQLPGRIFDQELLLHCFIEDGPEIRARLLLNSVLRVSANQIIQVRLQRQLVDRFDGS